MITLYGVPYSRAYRVMWMLKEIGLAFDHVPTDFLTFENMVPDYLGINPNGRVPAIVDGGVPIFESLAINLYLSRRYGGESAARGLIEEALATQWSLWAQAELDKALLLVAANRRFFAEADRRPDEVALGLKKLARPFTVLNAELANKPYLLGDRFTVADLNVATVLALIPLCDIPVDDYPVMAEWLTRCLERPAAGDWKPLMFTVPRPDDANFMAMFL